MNYFFVVKGRYKMIASELLPLSRSRNRGINEEGKRERISGKESQIPGINYCLGV